SFGMGRLTAENTAAQQKAYAECRRLAPLMMADYYPLTPYSRELNQWIAWQFDRPETGEGAVQAFRRSQSADDVVRLKLRGLDPGADYVLTDWDSGESQTIGGRELRDEGLAVSIRGQPGSAVIVYKKKGIEGIGVGS
ncbi:MAG TPA: GH36 C-terminal domain-containing protein, partial [Candidatus Anammoximicrobium sp.]|nr:GH36 C-terminal domain-containing protein [Candidatus Anammoximicrobium sp.]